MIYARSRNRCIGKDGRIPWHLPDEFGHFKKTTIGKPIIMGRKTYEDHESALPGRLNIVVSSQTDYPVAEGIVLANSLEDACEKGFAESDEVFVIGGVAFFSEAYKKADYVYETIVEADIDGDAFLPAFDFTAWNTELLEAHEVDDRHAFSYKAYRHARK